MEISVEPSKTYAVTTSGSCTVTDADGLELCTASSGSQAFFVATTPTVTISDDGAKVSRATFNYALAALGLLGGGADKLPQGFSSLDFIETYNPRFELPFSYNGQSGFRARGYIDFGNNGALCGNSAVYAVWQPDKSGELRAGTSASYVSLPLSSGKHNVEAKVNFLNSGVATLTLDGEPVSGAIKAATRTAQAFAIFGMGGYFSSGRVYEIDISAGAKTASMLRSAVDANGVVCFYDLKAQQPLYNNFGDRARLIAGVGSVAQLTTLLRNLPSTGGKLIISLPAEANTPEVADMLQACLDTKGWTLTVYEYRPAAAATYSLRRVREIVWCRKEQTEYGSYVDNFGTRWQIDRCVAIFGPYGQDPAAYGYEPFDSAEQATEEWGLVPYEYPKELSNVE